MNFQPPPPAPRTTSVALFMNESDAEDALVCMVSMACTHVYVKIHVVLFFKHCLICSRVQFHIQRIRFIYILNSGSTNRDTLIVTVIFKVQYIAVCKYFNGFTATHRGQVDRFLNLLYDCVNSKSQNAKCTIFVHLLLVFLLDYES